MKDDPKTRRWPQALALLLCGVSAFSVIMMVQEKGREERENDSIVATKARVREILKPLEGEASLRVVSSALGAEPEVFENPQTGERTVDFWVRVENHETYLLIRTVFDEKDTFVYLKGGYEEDYTEFDK